MKTNSWDFFFPPTVRVKFPIHWKIQHGSSLLSMLNTEVHNRIPDQKVKNKTQATWAQTTLQTLLAMGWISLLQAAFYFPKLTMTSYFPARTRQELLPAHEWHTAAPWCLQSKDNPLGEPWKEKPHIPCKKGLFLNSSRDCHKIMALKLFTPLWQHAQRC